MIRLRKSLQYLYVSFVLGVPHFEILVVETAGGQGGTREGAEAILFLHFACKFSLQVVQGGLKRPTSFQGSA